MKFFAVIGNPIAHSRSPDIHATFASQTGIELQYSKLLAPLDGFAAVVTAFFAGGGSGLNITVPFKEQAFDLAEIRSQRAQAAGAVNTLWMQNGVLHGDNTDGAGLVHAIDALKWPLQQAKILILGAGGATRGVILPLLQAGAQRIDIANRTRSRADQLIDDLQKIAASAPLNACALTELSGHYDLVINATSASLAGDGLQLPTHLSFDYAYEMAYGKPSAFLQQAEEKGAQTADGLGMLWGQAAEAFFVWHGVRPQF